MCTVNLSTSVIGYQEMIMLMNCMNINLGVVKNYIGSFSSNAEENINKTYKKSRHRILFEF